MPAVAAGTLRRALSRRMGSWEPIRQDLLLDAPAGGTGLPSELSSNDLLELLVLFKSLIPPPAQGVQAHEPGVGLFVSRLLGHHLPQRLDRPFVVLALLVQPGHLQEQREVRLV